MKVRSGSFFDSVTCTGCNNTASRCTCDNNDRVVQRIREERRRREKPATKKSDRKD